MPLPVASEMATSPSAAQRGIIGKSRSTKTEIDIALLDEIIFVHIRPEKKVFGVYKGLVCHSLLYFKGEFDGHFKEGQEGVVTLVDEKPEIFSLFYGWLYTNNIPETGDPSTKGSQFKILSLWMAKESSTWQQ